MLRTLLTLCLAVVLASPALAQVDMPMGEHMEGHMHEHMMETGMMDRMGDMMGMCLEHADKLKLTEVQEKKITPIHRQMQKEQVRYKADLKLSQIELKEIMEMKDFDLEKASAEVKKMADIKAAHHLAMLKLMKEVRTVLTDEQFKAMKKMMPMHMEGHGPAKKPIKKK